MCGYQVPAQQWQRDVIARRRIDEDQAAEDFGQFLRSASGAVAQVQRPGVNGYQVVETAYRARWIAS